MPTESKALAKGTGQTWIKWIAVTLVLAIIAFLTSPNGPLGAFWPPSHDFPQPTEAQLPFFIVLNAVEALVFGFGMAFLMFGYPLVQTMWPAPKWLTPAAYLSLAWLLISWWPHDSLHITNGTNMSGLLAIEYGFHVTVMVAGVILVYTLLIEGRRRGREF